MASIPRFFAQECLTHCSIPTFLCPIPFRLLLARRGRISKSRLQVRSLQVRTADTPRKALPLPSRLLTLPRTCPGCGAFTQITNPNNAGFYSLNRKSVSAFVAQQALEPREGGCTTRNPDFLLADTRLLQVLDPNRGLQNISGSMFGIVLVKTIYILTCGWGFCSKRQSKRQFATAVMIYYITMLGLQLSIQHYSQFTKLSPSPLIKTITFTTFSMRLTSLYH